MDKWKDNASDDVLSKTVESLQKNGIVALVVDTASEAKAKALELIEEGAEVMTMTSVTLDSTGISEEINKADSKYKPVRDKLYSMDKTTHAQEMNKMGAAPEVAIGSVHAITENGEVIIASNTGSQLPAYAYSALKVIWVAGTQKIVKDLDEGMKRIYDYVLPLESERAKKAYGAPGSNVSKLLIVNKEITKDRITLILVKELLGY
jgi:hypothetical protein